MQVIVIGDNELGMTAAIGKAIKHHHHGVDVIVVDNAKGLDVPTKTIPYKAPIRIEEPREPVKFHREIKKSPSKHKNAKWFDKSKNIKKRKQQKKARRRNRK